MGNKTATKSRKGLGKGNKKASKGFGHINPKWMMNSDWLIKFLCIFWPKLVRKALYRALNDAGTSRESEQVRETGEDYLAWYMNQTSYDVMDKMDELDNSIEKECS